MSDDYMDYISDSMFSNSDEDYDEDYGDTMNGYDDWQIIVTLM